MRRLIFLIIAACFFISPAWAEPKQNVNPVTERIKDLSLKTNKKNKKNYKLRNSVRTMLIGEDNLDLGTKANVTEKSVAADILSSLEFHPVETITAFVQGRALKNFGMASADTDNGEESTNGSFFEMRQLWMEIDQFLDTPSLSVKMGRQRIREEYGLWWNRDFDSLRLTYESEHTGGFIAIGQNLTSYRIGNSDDFSADEEDRLRLLGELSQEWRNAQFMEARFLYENDYSDTETASTLVPKNDRDDEDANLLWAGFRAKGEIRPEAFLSKITYRADTVAVVGEEKLLNTSPGPNASLRRVSGVTNRDVMGWAFDGNLDLTLREPDLTFMMGYAYGSGDDGTGTDNAFRQTGLNGNTSRHGDSKTTVLRNYGEVLRPELSNLHILNFGIGLPIFEHSDFKINYFSYWLDEKATRLRSSGINASLNNTDKHVGNAIDLASTINIGEELGLNQPLFDKGTVRIRLGGFKAGDAYGNAEGEYAYRGTIELLTRF